MFTILKQFMNGYLLGRAIGPIAKKRKNPMAAVSLAWGSIFSSGLRFNWAIRFVSKEVIEGNKEIGLEINAPGAIFATIPKICCVLVCLENLEEATKGMKNNEWACVVIQSIAHEYRHALQDEYFEANGLDADYALKYIASKYKYLESPVEQDAIQFSHNLVVYSESGCPKIKSSKWVEVSEAMKEVAEEVRQHPQVFDYKKA